MSFSGLMSIDIPAVITEFHELLTARNDTPTEEQQVRGESVNLNMHAIFHYYSISLLRPLLRLLQFA